MRRLICSSPLAASVEAAVEAVSPAEAVLEAPEPPQAARLSVMAAAIEAAINFFFMLFLLVLFISGRGAAPHRGAAFLKSRTFASGVHPGC